MPHSLWRTKSVEQSIQDTDEPGHKLKRKRPDLKRSYRVPLMPVIPILAVLACVWLMINLTAFTWVRFLGWMLVGVVIYFFYGRSHSQLGRPEGGDHGLAREEIRATYEAQQDASGRNPTGAGLGQAPGS